MTCTWCRKFTVELRAIGDNHSCGVCRTLDRLRSVCSRLPDSCGQDALNILRDTEVRLRDWVVFKGPPGGSYVRETSGNPGDSLASTLRLGDVVQRSSTGPEDRAQFKGSGSSSAVPPSRAPIPRARQSESSGATRNPSRELPGSPVGEPAEPLTPPPKRRRKNNRGQTRRVWQQARVDLHVARLHPTVNEEDEHFSEEEDYPDDLE